MPHPKRGTAFSLDISLVDSTNRPYFRTNPTLAAGDVKVSKDNGALANIATLPTVTPSGERIVNIALSATEMTADRVDIVFVDAAGGEWDDVMVTIHTTTVTVDDLVRSTTPANTLTVAADGTTGIGTINANAVNASALATDAVTEIRNGLGLASANLDTQLSGIATSSTSASTQTTATAIRAAIGLATANLDTQLNNLSTLVTAIKAKTDQFIFTIANKVDAALVTAASFPTSVAVNCWNVLDSAITVASTIGIRLKNFVDVAVSTRLSSASYTAPLTAAGTRAALGMANPNLDSQLITIAGYVDTEVAAILAKVNPLPTDPADASVIAGSFSSLTTLVNDLQAMVDALNIYVTSTLPVIQEDTDRIPLQPSAVGSPASLSDSERFLIVRDMFLTPEMVEFDLNFQQFCQLVAAATGGKCSGLDTNQAVYRNAVTDNLNRIVATVDEFGNREAIVYNLG